jgi:RND family efflux transporter MFP subunit
MKQCGLFPLILASFLVVLPVYAQDVYEVQPVEITDRKAVLATVQTVDMTPARARIGGTVVELLVDEGSHVKAGEVIARIVDEKLELEKQAVEARKASLQAERKLAAIALERASQLRKKGVGSQAKLDEARTNLDVVVKNLKAMDSERDLILQREREGAVLSPTNGRVLQVNVARGVVVMPGEAIANIADETYILRIEVPERHARFIRTGDDVSIGEGDTPRKGMVRQVYPEMRKGRVVADVSMDGLADYFIGERLRVYVATGTRSTFLVPENYVFTRSGLHFVRLEGGREVVVQPGRKQGAQLEILSGLQAGDILVGVSS